MHPVKSANKERDGYRLYFDLNCSLADTFQITTCSGFILSMFVDFGLYSSLMMSMETLPDSSVRTAFAKIVWRVTTYKLKKNFENLWFCLGRRILFICLFNTSIPYWNWTFGKVIAQNVWLLNGSWNWRFKCHGNWLLGIFIVLFKNHRRYVKIAPLHSVFDVCNDPFSIETLKQTRQMYTTRNWASMCHLRLSCFQVPKVPSVTYIKLFNNSS